MAKRRVAVVGAGVSGIFTMKHCVEEGLEPVCFEQQERLGGTWNFNDGSNPNLGPGIYRGMSANTPKEVMSASDFPMPDNTPHFMKGTEYHKYLLRYADHFGLCKYIQFNTTVIKVKKAPTFAEDGRWIVDTVENGKQKVEEFDAVALCTGPCRRPRRPDIPGLESFPGQVIMGYQYREPEVFKDKVVLVLGNSFSGGDIATFASRFAEQVYWCIGNGSWVMSRFTPAGEMLDYSTSRYSLARTTQAQVGESMKNNMCKALINHEQFGLEPKGGDPGAGAPSTLTEELPYQLKSGQILARPHVSRIVGRKAVFVDGTEVEVDIILAAVGYLQDYSMVECEQIQAKEHNKLKLYKWTFPINNNHPTLATMCSVFVLGSNPACIELQSRWVARVFAQKQQLPSEEKMTKHKEADNAYYAQWGEKLQIMGVDLQRDLAQELGVWPEFWSLLRQTCSPALLYRVFMGPILPVHYRLQGPGALPHAPDECFKAYDRIYNTPYYGKQENHGGPETPAKKQN